MATVQQVPLAEGLFSFPDDPHLLGSRCSQCGVHTFPRQEDCPRCSATAMEPVELATTGTLWTWTTQAFRPKTPPYLGPESDADFSPYLIGYVELPGQVKVEGRLVETTADQLTIGQQMELAIVPFRQDGDTEVVTFAFRPCA